MHTSLTKVFQSASGVYLTHTDVCECVCVSRVKILCFLLLCLRQQILLCEKTQTFRHPLNVPTVSNKAATADKIAPVFTLDNAYLRTPSAV